MEIKKTEKASLENKRLIFAEVGLIAALLVVFAGFESSTRAKEVALLQGNTVIDDEDDIMAIPLDTPPPAPEAPALPMLSDELQIVDDDVTIDLDFQSLDDTDVPVDIQEYVRQEVVEEDVEDDPIPFVTVEQKPTFNGGDANGFAKWVNSRLVYPEVAKENGVEGRVTLQFTIGKDGRLQDVKVLNSPDESLAQEAVRVVSSSPKW
ncbi:MAG: energy transducer TonB, partial [Bacteroidales bacterium]|nr:energy transducer TonB [Bacteroidales bacterium]